MMRIKNRPLGIWLFAIVIIIFNLHYWLLYPVYTGEHPSFHAVLELSVLAFFFWSSLILTIIGLYAVTYGFYNAKNWARLYEIGFLSYSSFWALMSMFVVRQQVYEHYIYFVLYVILIVYLFMSPVEEYFKKGAEDVCRYGDYTLYSRDVSLRSGRVQTIYFFSRKKPETGQPVGMPEGYVVHVNTRTGMPYLKKER